MSPLATDQVVELASGASQATREVLNELSNTSVNPSAVDQVVKFWVAVPARTSRLNALAPPDGIVADVTTTKALALLSSLRSILTTPYEIASAVAQSSERGGNSTGAVDASENMECELTSPVLAEV